MKSLQLRRDLRKSILQGHPWVYGEALCEKPKAVQFIRLLDKKGEFLAWGFADPYSPIAFRVLAIDKKIDLEKEIAKRLQRAFECRRHLLNEDNNIFRFINGEGDLLPGLVGDFYNGNLVVQFDGKAAKEFWLATNALTELENLDFVNCLCIKPREKGEIQILKGQLEDVITAKENAIQFQISIAFGQKTGFFIDQRNNRQYLAKISKAKSLINLFSYTGGFSMAAGKAGAKKVYSVDISQKALDLADENWNRNAFEGEHTSIKMDIFSGIEELPECDIMVIDPPSLASSEQHKIKAMEKYIHCFKAGMKKLKPGSDLLLSSCSSHISYEDFMIIIEKSLSKARKTARILYIGGQGEDHPFPHICHELRYLKFVHLKIN